MSITAPTIYSVNAPSWTLNLNKRSEFLLKGELKRRASIYRPFSYADELSRIIATKPKSIACMHMSLFNYLPINAFRLICGVSIICHQKLENIFIFVTKNLVFFERHPVL